MSPRTLGAAAAAAVFALLPAGALADGTGWYVAGHVGMARYVDTDTSGRWVHVGTGDGGRVEETGLAFESGTGFAAAVGYDLGEARVEAAVSRSASDFRDTELDDADGELSVFGVMANVWFDFDLGSGLAPYVGGGLGVAWATIDEETGFSETSNPALAWQAGAGVGYALSPAATLQVGYRYARAEAMWEYRLSDGPVTADLEVEAGLASHNFEIGARIAF